MRRIAHARDVDLPPKPPPARKTTLGALEEVREGTIVQVSGRIAEGETFGSFRHGRPVVAERLQLLIGWVGGSFGNDLLVYERTLDFELRDDGCAMIVRAAEARFGFGLKQMRHDDLSLLRRLEELQAPPLSNARAIPTILYTHEISLAPGSRVVIVGIKQREIDPLRPRLEREIPARTVVRAIMLTPE